MLKAHLLWDLLAVEGMTPYPARGSAESGALGQVWAMRQIPGTFTFMVKSTFSLAHECSAKICEHGHWTEKIPLVVSSSEINNNFHTRLFSKTLPSLLPVG